jgi:hypothetical protein
MLALLLTMIVGISCFLPIEVTAFPLYWVARKEEGRPCERVMRGPGGWSLLSGADQAPYCIDPLRPAAVGLSPTRPHERAGGLHPPAVGDLLILRQDVEQLANLPLLDEGMPQGELRLDLVAVPPALSLAQHVALFD